MERMVYDIRETVVLFIAASHCSPSLSNSNFWVGRKHQLLSPQIHNGMHNHLLRPHICELLYLSLGQALFKHCSNGVCLGLLVSADRYKFYNSEKLRENTFNLPSYTIETLQIHLGFELRIIARRELCRQPNRHDFGVISLTPSC